MRSRCCRHVERQLGLAEPAYAQVFVDQLADHPGTII